MIDLMSDRRVSVYRDASLEGYPQKAPFSPSERYPEYPFEHLSGEENRVYNAVRSALYLLGLDRENFGTKAWNPLGEIIRPGDKVVIKPNFVLDKHYNEGVIECVITQPSVIRAVCDYAHIALKGQGELVIADAPQANCDFENLLAVTRLEEIGAFYRENTGSDIPVYDLRQLRLRDFTDSRSRVIQDGDPCGYAVVDMGEQSAFYGSAGQERLYGADYDREETMRHHQGSTHEYCVAKTVLSADVVISVPKMKVHRKAGVTLNMKNLIGINGNKNYLPHFRIGTPAEGGDEYPVLTEKQNKLAHAKRKAADSLLAHPSGVKSDIYQIARKGISIINRFFPKYSISQVVTSGDWSGNDTVWRTLLDLNTILIYADKNGTLHDTPQRRFLSVIDGIIGGENEGPLIPDPKPCGVIACGLNPLTTDMAVARIMGFAPEKIPKFRHAAEREQFVFSHVAPEDILVFSNIEEYETAMSDKESRFLDFSPSRGWKESIEV